MSDPTSSPTSARTPNPPPGSGAADMVRRARRAVWLYLVITALIATVVVLLLPVLAAAEPIPRGLATARVRSEFCQSGCRVRYSLFPKAAQEDCRQRCMTHPLTTENFDAKEALCRQRCPDSDPTAETYLTSADLCMVTCLPEELATIEEGWEVKSLPSRGRAEVIQLTP